MNWRTEFRLVREGEGQPACATCEDRIDAAPKGADGGWDRLMRRRLLRAMAADVLDRHPDAVRFERGAEGRVRITGPERLYTSVAGRGGWTALAMSSRPVGVDVEAYAPDLDPPLGLLQPEEQNAILAGPDPMRLFLRFWTAREAYLKAGGRGLSVMPDQIRAEERDGGVALIEAGRPVALAELIECGDAIAAIVELSPAA